jgi:hypothetical protein
MQLLLRQLSVKYEKKKKQDGGRDKIFFSFRFDGDSKPLELGKWDLARTHMIVTYYVQNTVLFVNNYWPCQGVKYKVTCGKFNEQNVNSTTPCLIELCNKINKYYAWEGKGNFSPIPQVHTGVTKEPRYIMYRNRTVKTDKEIQHNRPDITLLTTPKSYVQNWYSSP